MPKYHRSIDYIDMSLNTIAILFLINAALLINAKNIDNRMEKQMFQIQELRNEFSGFSSFRNEAKLKYYKMVQAENLRLKQQRQKEIEEEERQRQKELEENKLKFDMKRFIYVDYFLRDFIFNSRL